MLRARARAARDGLVAVERGRLSAAIVRRLIEIAEHTRPAVVAAYAAIGSEVDPAAFLGWAQRSGLTVVLPAATGNGLVFRVYEEGAELTAGGFGTRAPGEGAAAVDPDMMVVPLVGFDRNGTRLGYGRGHYDRAIAGLRNRGRQPLLVGVAFAAQEVPAIPAEAHDVKLDIVVTENETLDLRR